MRKILLGYVLFFTILFMIFFGNKMDMLNTNDYYKYQSETGVQYVAKTIGKEFSIYESNGGWRELFVAGVNLGASKPGYFPGDFGITREDYLRWFKHISGMNANTIRIYVLQMPEFYQAFKEYNETAEKPLYLIHGVYMNEADVQKYQNAYAEDGLIRNSFLRDIRNTVDVIHGNARVEKTMGHAGGSYDADISRYVIGWILGIEWETEFVRTTNESNPQLKQYDGAYLYTQNATPFEVFLAEAADTAVSYEMQHYNEQRPLAMSNWVTSDPLNHPGEPFPEKEDGVSVDMEKLLPKDSFEAGFFASYHVYPYYPDFFNYDQKYLQGKSPNSYRAYLEELNGHHTMPVLISEVGIPSSRGLTHENIHSGFNQGHVTETEQGEMLVSLMKDIHSENMMGAIIFSWQDEWFKRTWNTMDLDVASRRPYWMNGQTSEQSFGLLSFDPGRERSVSYVDGDISEWAEGDVVVQDGKTRLSVKNDEKYLYLMVETDRFEKEILYLPINTIAGQGNTQYKGNFLVKGADFLLVLDGKDNSTLLIDPYYDTNYFLYGHARDIMPRIPAYEQTDTGLFVPIHMMLDRGFTLPNGRVIPYSVFNTGRIRYGMANPDNKGYDSLADFYTGNGVVEIRLPWLLLNIADPSSRQVIGNLYAENKIVHQQIDGIDVGFFCERTNRDVRWGQYSWQEWETPTYHERLKDSYPIIQAFYAEIDEAAVRTRTGFEVFWGRWNQAHFANIGFWFPIQPVLNYLLAFLMSVIIYFFLVLLYIHTASALRSQHRGQLQRRIYAVVENKSPLAYSKNLRRHTIPGLRRPFSRNSLIIFSQIMEGSDERVKEQVRKIMLAIGYDNYVQKQLSTRDIGYLILLVRMIGELRLKEQSGAVKALLYKHKGNTDFEYQGLLTLSVLGDYNNIVSVTTDERFVTTLSFRSLQEIFKSFNGDRQRLYDSLLDSPDAFIRRIAIKRIGLEGFTNLAKKISPCLDAQNYNTVIDAARTLGQLGDKNAAPKIAGLLEHKQWEVRAVAVTALSSIDMERYEAHIIKALSDPEWQVRNNAALVLSKCPHADRILTDVAASGDRYAYEALNYMVITHGIWRTVQ